MKKPSGVAASRMPMSVRISASGRSVHSRPSAENQTPAAPERLASVRRT